MRRLLIVPSAMAVGFAVLILSPAPRIERAAAVGTTPVGETVVARHDEPRYLAGVAELLDEAISNRVNLDRALRTRRAAAEYRRLLDDFRSRQLGFLVALERLEPPARLILFHERLRAATHEQIAFYAAFVAAKARDASIDLDRMLEHPALRASSADIRAASEHLRRLYPSVDGRAEAAIEARLVWFEIL